MGIILLWYMATVFASVGCARELNLPFDLAAAFSFVRATMEKRCVEGAHGFEEEMEQGRVLHQV